MKPNSQTTEFFQTNGYVIKRSFIGAEQLARIQHSADEICSQRQGPAEYEADVHYTGAPESRSAQGGQTIRRFLEVFDRDRSFSDFATGRHIKATLKQLMQDEVYLVRTHHNSLMTKHPKYSSQTNWHRDIRYWHYDNEDLISIWLALGYETRDNGALMLIPGSHRIEFERQNFNEKLFFRKDFPENKALIDSAVMAELAPGDVLFFHCRTLHAASNNTTNETKRALVYTYRPASTLSIPGTRSSELEDVPL